MTEPDSGLLTADPPQTTQQENWYPEEYKEVVGQKGWASPSDALKSYTELEKTMGSRVKIPTPESSAEERSNFYAKIGRPENPDGYEIKDVPENVIRDENIESMMRKVAFETGVTKTAFETLVKSYYDNISQQLTQTKVEGENALKGEWKDKYDTNLEIARRFAREGGDEFFEFLQTSGIGNNPVVVKAFFTYGTKILDDSLIKGEQGGTKEEYIPSNKNSPEMYSNGDDEDSKKARAYFRARGHVYDRQD